MENYPHGYPPQGNPQQYEQRPPPQYREERPDRYRDRDSDRHRGHDRHRDHDRDRHHRKHRSDRHRHRDRSRDRDYRDRDRDYDRERRHKKRKRSYSSRRRSDSRDRRHKHKKSSHRRSESHDSIDRYYNKLKKRVDAGIPTKFHAQPDPKYPTNYVTPQEKLEEYKRMHPDNDNTVHNKTDRQLYVGNLPPDVTISELCRHLNDAMFALNLSEKEERPVVDAWISGDGHYAFVEFRTIKAAHLGFQLQQIAIHGHALKVGRPKIANSSYAALAQQMNAQSKYDNAVQINQQPAPGYGNQNAVAASTAAMGNQFDNVLKNLPGPPPMPGMPGMPASNPSEFKSKTITITKLLVSNLPLDYSEAQVRDILSVVGHIKDLEMITDPNSGKYRGEVYVQYEKEEDSRKAETTLMGMNISDAFLHVKKVQSTTLLQDDATANVLPQMAAQAIQPSCCLALNNLLMPEQIQGMTEYTEVEDETFDEMEQYGKVHQVVAPKPDASYVPGQILPPGVGKVYIKFSTIEEAHVGKKAMEGRRFEGRIVEANFYPEDKFRSGVFE